MICNKSAFPARALKNGTLRYWFTLDSGDSAANLTLSANYSECGPQTGEAGQRGRHALLRRAQLRRPEHHPGGQSQHRRELQFRVTGGSTWNAANDPSFAGLTSTALAKTKAITLYDGGKLIWGTEPTGTVTDTTAPSVPGTPVASGITSTGASLSWTASTDTGSGVAGLRRVPGAGLDLDPRRPRTTSASTVLSGLTPSTAYSYTVKAKDVAGNVSAASSAGTFTTADPPNDGVIPPTTPGTPVASSVTSTGATLTWTASTAGTNPLTRVRGATGSAGRRRTVVGTATGTTFALTGLTAGTAYTYTVRAKDSPATPRRASTAVTFTTTTADRHHRAHRARHPGGLVDHPDRRDPHLGRVDRLRWQRAGRVRRVPGPGLDLDPGGLADVGVDDAHRPHGEHRVHVRGAGQGRAPATPRRRARRSTFTTLPTTSTSSCAVTYSANSWNVGFTGSVKVTNTSTSPLTWKPRVHVPLGPAGDPGLERHVVPDGVRRDGDRARVERHPRPGGQHGHRVQRVAHRHQHGPDRLHGERGDLHGRLT